MESAEPLVVHARPADLIQAQQLALALSAPIHPLQHHRFPDGECMEALGGPAGHTALLFANLAQPEGKLFGLLQAANAARLAGARRVLLVAPYLPYLRQDKVFGQGQPVSAQVIGRLLGQCFDLICTVDPHLHRVHSLDELVGPGRGLCVGAAPALHRFLRERRPQAVLVGPDEESRQWVSQTAGERFSWQVASKVRRGDYQVEVSLEDPQALQGRQVVVVDDIISSGRTIVRCAQAALRAGATEVCCAATHGLLAGDAQEAMAQAGVSLVWCADSIPGPQSVITLAPLLADALRRWLDSSQQ